jgi:magnesium chelatase subunit I
VAEGTNFPLLPYSYIVGQDRLKWLLEVDYVMRSSVGGVLISGERGTAKSTIVRSFANMINGQLPVTLPINATDGRVVGDWDIKSLKDGNPEEKPGLLEKAGKAGMLYIDEVNLLDDHIINLILDVASTSVLVVEREGMDKEITLSFSLVGTMNPEEGALRPQLLDRFGLFMDMKAEPDPAVRANILRTVLRFDAERNQGYSRWLEDGRSLDHQRQDAITSAKRAASFIDPADDVIELCAAVAAKFDVVGHRAEIVMARAACAAAALDGRFSPGPRDVKRVAVHAIMHRRRNAAYTDKFEWTPADEESLAQVTSAA